jgi:hypothetical protein
MKPKHPPGDPMTLGNMRKLGVRGLAVYCINPNCQHQTVISADDYADDVAVPWFGQQMVCTTCGMIGADARPNWLEQPVQPSDAADDRAPMASPPRWLMVEAN